MNPPNVDDLRRRAAQARGDARALLDAAEGETRTLSGTERSRFDELLEEADEMEQRVDDITAAEEARQAAEASAKRYGGTEITSIRVGKEEAIYGERSDHSFFKDLYFGLHRRTDTDALDRISRHLSAAPYEQRDLASSGMGALVPAQFLTGDFAAVARAGRPLANLLMSERLPANGTVFNVPKGSTGTVVASQTSENSAVAEQDYTVDDVVMNLVTIAGQQDLSRQTIDRGVNVDQLVMGDLAAGYAAELDFQLMRGTGANGQHFGVITSVTGSNTVSTWIESTTTSVPQQLRNVADGIQRIQSNLKLPPTVIIAHPRRWMYWTAATDDNGRPLVPPSAQTAQNSVGQGDLAGLGPVVGNLFGVPVVTDANVPTTLSTQGSSTSDEDAVIITRASEQLLLENSPVPTSVEFQETLAGQLTVKVVAWGYSASTWARYGNSSTVHLTGVGMAAPTF